MAKYEKKKSWNACNVTYTCSAKHSKGRWLPREGVFWKGPGGRRRGKRQGAKGGPLKWGDLGPTRQEWVSLARLESPELQSKAAGVLTRCHWHAGIFKSWEWGIWNEVQTGKDQPCMFTSNDQSLGSDKLANILYTNTLYGFWGWNQHALYLLGGAVF